MIIKCCVQLYIILDNLTEKLSITNSLGTRIFEQKNKNFEQNYIFERAGRGTIVRVTISMSIYEHRKPHQG